MFIEFALEAPASVYRISNHVIYTVQPISNLIAFRLDGCLGGPLYQISEYKDL